MGATFVAVIVNGDEMRWVSVGDSPLYLVADGRIERLNADHSMAPQIDAMVARGLHHRPAGGEPSRPPHAARGGDGPSPDPDRRRQPRLRPGARLLLCSDGVQSLDDAGIAAQAAGPVRALIEAVLAVGAPHQDNVTVIKLERKNEQQVRSSSKSRAGRWSRAGMKAPPRSSSPTARSSRRGATSMRGSCRARPTSRSRRWPSSRAARSRASASATSTSRCPAPRTTARSAMSRRCAPG